MLDEGSYSDSTSESSYEKTTPSQRFIRETTISQAGKCRVDRATCSNSELIGRRCLVENTDESNIVEYVHCLPRSTKGGLLDSLEFAWNMPRFTLNVDSRYNVIRLSANFQKLYDSGRWLLLPETSIINEYHKARDKREFPNIDQPVYRYTLIAHRDMRLVPIHRQNSIPTDEDTPPMDFSLYTHPYHNFPTIVSHAHPRFVICNAGAKLAGNLKVWSQQGVRVQDMIMINDIWNAWSKAVDQDQPDGRAFIETNPSNDNISDTDSQHTAPHRVLRRGLKRNSPEEQNSLERSSKRRKGGNDSAWLDDEMLSELNQQTLSLAARGTDRKKQSVLDWLGGISDTEADTGAEENSLEHGDTLDATMTDSTLAEHS